LKSSRGPLCRLPDTVSGDLTEVIAKTGFEDMAK
jgi:hypothetical protein